MKYYISPENIVAIHSNCPIFPVKSKAYSLAISKFFSIK